MSSLCGICKEREGKPYVVYYGHHDNSKLEYPTPISHNRSVIEKRYLIESRKSIFICKSCLMKRVLLYKIGGVTGGVILLALAGYLIYLYTFANYAANPDPPCWQPVLLIIAGGALLGNGILWIKKPGFMYGEEMALKIAKRDPDLQDYYVFTESEYDLHRSFRS